jgi:hypothetical protein
MNAVREYTVGLTAHLLHCIWSKMAHRVILLRRDDPVAFG